MKNRLRILQKTIGAVFLLMTACSFQAQAQETATVKEYEKEYTTHPFSDPNPIPAFGKIYPYFRYDGYTTQPEKKRWKIVEMENQFLRIRIFPQIGGKIWSVFDKKAQKEMFYDNDAVKFRDVSLRGPWTSGGIEFNYGVVGHSPTCSFPVDYITRTNADGSASCIIGMLDLLTRSRWNVEINLPKDKAWFTTSSFWYNQTGAYQPYYNWTNTGVTAKNDLHFTYPGTHIIRHDGITFPWPMDTENNKDLSIWSENNFIGSKSYHITGSARPYFGAFWANDNFGILQYAGRDQKIGKKIFSWALSDQGTIWKELLTDRKEQYVEMQSGRLFNQNMEISSLTPYKQISFLPYNTDVWKEYWFAYHGIGKVDYANLCGISHVEKDKEGVQLDFYPLQSKSGTLTLHDDKGKVILQSSVSVKAAEAYSNYFKTDGIKVCTIKLAGQEIWSNRNDTLNRPVETMPDFNWDTAYGNYLRGRDLSGMRLYAQAETFIRKSLEKDPGFLPALTEMSALCYRKMNYDSAFICARRALAIDQYDSRANYEYGRSAQELGRFNDACDGYELATLTPQLRSAAYTALSKLYFKQKEFEKARKYAEESLTNNAYNMEGLQLICLCKSEMHEDATGILERIHRLDPLSPFVLFEKHYRENGKQLQEALTGNIRSDLANQTYLELAVEYHSLGLDERATKVLSLIPKHNGETRYWQAFLQKNTSAAQSTLENAEKENSAFVFPFRQESKEIFEWALTAGNSWKPKYYLALLHQSSNNPKEAVALLQKCGSEPDFSPFYSLRASLQKGNPEKEADMKQAIRYAPQEWRYVHQLTRFYIEQKQYAEAQKTIEPFYNQHKSHFPTGSLYAKVLICNQNYNEADKILAQTYILPFEGERGGRVLYRQIKLMRALQALKKGKTHEAEKRIKESFLWPRNIGTGKPYEETIDYRLENWMLALTYMKASNNTLSQEALKKTAYSSYSTASVETLLQALALHKLGDNLKADALFDNWAKAQSSPNLKRWGETFYRSDKSKDDSFDYERLSRIIGLISGTEDIRLF